MNIKRVHHVCIQTDKYQESFDFYTQVLGFEVVKETKDFHGRSFNTWLKSAEFMLELQTAKRGEELLNWSSHNCGPVHLCFLVEDIMGAYEDIKRKGYSDFKKKDGQEVYEVENGYLFKVKAPEGTEIEIRDNADL